MAATIPKPNCPQADLLGKAGLKGKILVPLDPEYIARQESFWSNTAKVKPACIVRPTSADEVSTVIKCLVASDEKFAVRSGGHNLNSGFNNLEGGVTIDLGLLNWTKFDEASETVDIGPGCRWSQVFAELQKFGRTVTGGRDGNVGVAGLLLGGGNTYCTARWGLACDNVVACEVVLANGAIITADVNNHADLLRALKGGSNNFGIVTSFKMRTIKCEKIWGGLKIYPKHTIPDAAHDLVHFTDNISEDLESNFICNFAYMDVVLGVVCVHIGAKSDASLYKKWNEVPGITGVYKTTTMTDITNDLAMPVQYRDIWFTLLLKNDQSIVKKVAELHEMLVEELKAFIPDGDFVVLSLLQPFPTLLSRRSADFGGNVLGLDRQPHNCLLWLPGVGVRTSEQESFVRPKVKALLEQVREFAATIPGDKFEWVYLNYADKIQNPLASYGAENIKRMKEVAIKYDPDEVFQKLCPGGFKLSQVDMK